MRRALLDPIGRPFRLEIERWSERGKRAKLDEIWWGRVKARMPGNRGWFVDLGLERDGVVEPTRAAAVIEGALLAVRIKSEAWADKGPVLSLADMSPQTPRPGKPALHAAPVEDPFLRGVEVVATITEQAARAACRGGGGGSVAAHHRLQGGGDIAIDTARGLTVIDVDAASAQLAAMRRRLHAISILQQPRKRRGRSALRGLGGLVAVDFVGMKRGEGSAAVVEGFRKSLADWLGRVERSAGNVARWACARRRLRVASGR